MKKILSIFAILLIATTGFAQQPISNLYMSTQSVPPYAIGSHTGNVLTYSYLHAAVPSSTHDTLRLVTTNNISKIEFDSVNGFKTTPFVIMADTTGDTASYANYPTGKATVWYKKNPFLQNYNCDEVQFIFHGNQTSYSTVKFGAMFLATGITATDTLHIPIYVKSTGAGGATATFQYDYLRNRWTYKGSSTW